MQGRRAIVATSSARSWDCRSRLGAGPAGGRRDPRSTGNAAAREIASITLLWTCGRNAARASVAGLDAWVETLVRRRPGKVRRSGAVVVDAWRGGLAGNVYDEFAHPLVACSLAQREKADAMVMCRPAAALMIGVCWMGWSGIMKGADDAYGPYAGSALWHPGRMSTIWRTDAQPARPQWSYRPAPFIMPDQPIQQRPDRSGRRRPAHSPSIGLLALRQLQATRDARTVVDVVPATPRTHRATTCGRSRRTLPGRPPALCVSTRHQPATAARAAVSCRTSTSRCMLAISSRCPALADRRRIHAFPRSPRPIATAFPGTCAEVGHDGGDGPHPASAMVDRSAARIVEDALECVAAFDDRLDEADVPLELPLRPPLLSCRPRSAPIGREPLAIFPPARVMLLTMWYARLALDPESAGHPPRRCGG